MDHRLKETRLDFVVERAEIRTKGGAHKFIREITRALGETRGPECEVDAGEVAAGKGARA